MNFKWQPKYVLSLLLSLAAVILVVFTWTSLFTVAYNLISPLPFEQFYGLDTPTRVAGLNYPISFIIKFISSIAILLLLLFLFGWKKKYSSASYWINSIAISIMVPHIFLWVFLIHPY
ncbi:MAG TPA: hypothetical protein PKW25_10375 [Syntrophomonadaceae bacterium]|nr:hypothetical protein [Syntrophomonadaceae bacterium]